MKIGGFQKTTLVDYPGRVASIVFVAGCNMRCGYCYNAPLVFMKTKTVPEEQVLEHLKANKKLVDAVVVTGGEPTVWPDLPRFIHSLKQEGFRVKLDTNGSNPQMLEAMLAQKLVDYAAMDVKAPWEKYFEVCGARPLIEKIKASIELIKSSGVDYEFRTTAAPGLTAEDLRQVALQIKPASKWFLQTFSPCDDVLDPSVLEKPWLSREQLDAIASDCKRFFGECRARGSGLPLDSARGEKN